MQKEHIFICINCPMGCRMSLTVDDKGNITNITGHECKEGKGYAENEYRNPVRVLTGTLLTDSSKRRTLPFRTNKPILKGRLEEAMRCLGEMRVKTPVMIGQVIVPNILNMGVDIIATDKIS